MSEFRLYIAQRLSAAVLAPLVLLHLGVMIYAIQGGLSAEEILARTRGSLFWGTIYGVFVLAVAVHAAVGLRNILHDWGGLRAPWLGYLGWGLFAALLVAGLRAVGAVVIA
jgi:fumarate reductase subunit C